MKLEEIHKAHNNDTIFICGHSTAPVTPIAARADLLNFRDYLAALMSFVGGLVKEGKTRDEVLARRDVLKGFEDYGQTGHPRLVSLIRVLPASLMRCLAVWRISAFG